MIGRIVNKLRPTNKSAPKARSPVRTFPSSGYVSLPVSNKIEEETLEWYSPKVFYPVYLGQIFERRYQVISKAGYGSSSTVWLARDLEDHKYVALKICISNYPSIPRESASLQRLREIKDTSPWIQKSFSEFTIRREDGIEHKCFVLEPLSISLLQFNRVFFDNGEWDLSTLRQTAKGILEALKFLHSQAKLIHCDLRRENLLMRPADDKCFRAFEEHELKNPVERKVEGDRVVYTSRTTININRLDRVVLCDFGESRPGLNIEPHLDDIQPLEYRAPEVILSVPFSYSVDIWNAGVLLWHLFEGKALFHPFSKSGKDSNWHHLRQMVALMGPPPPAFLERSHELDHVQTQFFDANGQWLKKIPMVKMSLESEEKRLDGEEKANFLRFMRRFLQWDPDMRPTAAELCEDPWLSSP